MGSAAVLLRVGSAAVLSAAVLSAAVRWGVGSAAVLSAAGVVSLSGVGASLGASTEACAAFRAGSVGFDVLFRFLACGFNTAFVPLLDGAFFLADTFSAGRFGAVSSTTRLEVRGKAASAFFTAFFDGVLALSFLAGAFLNAVFFAPVLAAFLDAAARVVVRPAFLTTFFAVRRAAACFLAPTFFAASEATTRFFAARRETAFGAAVFVAAVFSTTALLAALPRTAFFFGDTFLATLRAVFAETFLADAFFPAAFFADAFFPAAFFSAAFLAEVFFADAFFAGAFFAESFFCAAFFADAFFAGAFFAEARFAEAFFAEAFFAEAFFAEAFFAGTFFTEAFLAAAFFAPDGRTAVADARAADFCLPAVFLPALFVADRVLAALDFALAIANLLRESRDNGSVLSRHVASQAKLPPNLYLTCTELTGSSSRRLPSGLA